jgi:hypothetical protein
VVLLGDEAQVEASFVPLEMVVNLMQDRCMVCAKHTIGLEIILDTPNGTPSDEAQVEARFGPFGDSVHLDEVHGLRRTYHRLRNRFGRIRWNS